MAIPRRCSENRSVSKAAAAGTNAKLLAGFFDVKHSPGGMVDAEFAVQYLVLAHSRLRPTLRANLGNIALLCNAEQAGLLPQGVGQSAASAYRQLRQTQHLARLDEASTQVPTEQLLEQQQAIFALWRVVFN